MCFFFFLDVAVESPNTRLGREHVNLLGQVRETALAVTGAPGEGKMCWEPAGLTQTDNATGMNRLIPKPCV